MTLHTIHFMRHIGADTLNGLQNCVMQALHQGASTIKIYMSSEGGSNDAGFAAYNFLRSLPVPLEMHCIGNVESMAVVVYLAADIRVIVPHGRVKLHALHWGFAQGQVDHDRLAEYVDSLDFDAKRYAALFNERTAGSSNPIDVSAALAGRAIMLDADAAVSSGFATGIADASIPASATRWWV